MKSTIQVNFESGQELLTSYWGYLSGGGLIIRDPGVEVGNNVSLHIRIDSSLSDYRLEGVVVKRERNSAKAIIAFQGGEAHNMLLSEALADSEKASPRRFARFTLDTSVTVRSHNSELRATLLNLSDEGCCLRLGTAALDALMVDDRVQLIEGDVHALAVVVWSRFNERGLSMTLDQAEPLMHKLRCD